MTRTALVVGAGVSGLSSAIRLLEHGFDVTIRAKARTPNTTSDVAAAYYYPFRAEPKERVVGWSKASLAEFRRIARDAPEAGVYAAEMLHVYPTMLDAPWWADLAPGWRNARVDELPPGYACGFVAPTFIVEMPRYMPWLEARAQKLGARFEQGQVADVRALDASLVVNCTGLGAREAAADAGMFPIRGQIVRMQHPGITRIWSDSDGPNRLAYIAPRRDLMVVGGTAQENDWRLEPNAAEEIDIIRRASNLEPRIRDARIVGRAVGLRPGRATVRLEREGRVIHNYGHAGAGVTLSWGCADAVLALARA